jgi:hypothetical protein
MKKATLLKALFVVFLMISFSSAYAQDWRTFTWEPYKTKFKVPGDFSVTTSSGEEWSGTNRKITMDIYPRKNENLSRTEMKNNLYSWAADNGVKNIGDVTVLDEEKLNGYWGYMYEGNKGEFPVAVMMLVDPDYPDISLYIWVSYKEGYEDTVIEMLMSFTPN